MTPPELFYVLTSDLELYRSLHHLNSTLLNESQEVQPIKPLPKDLSYLLVDPEKQLRMEYEPEHPQQLGILSNFNKLYF